MSDQLGYKQDFSKLKEDFDGDKIQLRSLFNSPDNRGRIRSYPKNKFSPDLIRINQDYVANKGVRLVKNPNEDSSENYVNENSSQKKKTSFSSSAD